MSLSTDDTFAGKAFRFVIGRNKKQPTHGDASREVFETVVFVVVLVLMLKLFVAEAFVIPTGSMASTLWGDQIYATCPECDHSFAASSSVDRSGKRKVPSEVVCQNCGVRFTPANPNDWSSGDRVLVSKYEYHIRDPKRFDVPVFKYPSEPYRASDKSAMNYIKRLVGLPGETIAIYKGDLYRTTALNYPRVPRPIDPKTGEERAKDLWQAEYTYPNDESAVKLFEAGGFEPIRKTPKEIMAVRRLVFDLDKQPKSLTGLAKVRWQAGNEDGSGWSATGKGFDHDGQAEGWIKYAHVEPGSWRLEKTGATTPKQHVPIKDHLAYNLPEDVNSFYWVPDLMLECDVKLSSASDRVVLELIKAGDRYQAVFDNGICRLVVNRANATAPVTLAEAEAKLSMGSTSVRFANFDSRLTVWVDGRPLKFGDKADYDPPSLTDFKPTVLDESQPARIGATGNVSITKLKLWRDVYYTCRFSNQECGVQTYYVQPGHYFCLGDNSSASEDGRSWGLVPERLMLGRAIVVYWPLTRVGVIK